MAESKTGIWHPDNLFEEIQPDIDAAYDHHIQTNPRKDRLTIDPYAAVPLENYSALREEHEAHVQLWADQGVDVLSVIRAYELVNTATEDNLPYYTAQIIAGFESWRLWNYRWTAEEGSHGETMIRGMDARGYIDLSQEWQPLREKNKAAGMHVEIETPADGVSYVAVQELLTKMAHFSSGNIMDKSARKNIRAIAGDEGRHYQFYLKALKAMALRHPDYVLGAMRRQHEGDAFDMPGKDGIEHYGAMSKTIAAAGLFDAITILRAQKQTIEEAALLTMQPQTDQGKADQEWAATVANESSDVWVRKQKLMQITRERAAKRAADQSDELRPFILGATVELNGNDYSAIAE